MMMLNLDAQPIHHMSIVPYIQKKTKKLPPDYYVQNVRQLHLIITTFLKELCPYKM